MYIRAGRCRQPKHKYWYNSTIKNHRSLIKIELRFMLRYSILYDRVVFNPFSAEVDKHLDLQLR